MTLSAWVVGSLLLAAMIVASGLAGRSIRRWALPGWVGAPTSLVDVVLAIAVVTGTSQALGAVGLFRPLDVTIACVAVSAVLVGLVRARPEPAPAEPDQQRDAEGVGAPSALWTHAAIGAVAVVVAQWSSFTAESVRAGVTNEDSIWYHLTRAARFTQTGWTTRLHHTAPEFPDAFHPSNAELLQALPMLAYGRDALSPFVSLLWVPALLLAAWCVGRPFGRGAVSLTGVAALLGSPLLLIEGAGTAGNDLAAIFFLLAAVAILLQPGGRQAQVAIAGVAAGMALSTKLTVIPAVVVLTVAVVWAAPRAARRAHALAWALPLIGFGAYWYVRNLLTVGSPVPSTNLPLFGHRSFRIADELGFSVSDYLTDQDVWRDWFLPGLRFDFGWGWPLLALGFVAATIGAVRQHGDRLVQGIGVLLPVSAIAYVVLPTTALGQPGEPLLFAANVVYLVPALMLALTVLPTLRSLRSEAWASTLLGAYVLLLGLAALTSPGRSVAPGTTEIAVAAGMATATAGIVALHRRPPRRALAAAGVVAVLLVAIGGYAAADRYMDGRYQERSFYRWANNLTDTRIAIAGFGGQFPFYGAQLDNTVQYVGDVRTNGEFHDLEDCTAWREALRDGEYDLVILRSERSDVDETELRWTSDDPAATLVHEVEGGHVFRFEPEIADPGCS